MNSDARDLPTIEALYQIVRGLAAEKHVLLSREQFCAMPFTVVSTCDGLLAIVKAGLPLNLLMQAPAPRNGIGARR